MGGEIRVVITLLFCIISLPEVDVAIPTMYVRMRGGDNNVADETLNSSQTFFSGYIIVSMVSPKPYYYHRHGPHGHIY